MTHKKKHRTKKINRIKSPNFSGQHLMHNKRLIHEMIDQAKISTHDLVLDLGAGKGALTSFLNKRAKMVFAVEYDRKFVEFLKQEFIECPNVKVIQQDILKIHLPKEPFIVVSNIPYAITTPILKMLLNRPTSHLQKGVIVMEKGAAKRFTSSFVKDPYVIAWRMWFDIRYVRDISRKNFSPPPRVDSAMITISRRAKPIVSYGDYFTFWGLVDYMLKNPQYSIDIALRGVFTPPQIKRLKRNLQIKHEVLVGALSEQQWGFIFETMVKHVPKFRWPKINKAKLNHY